MADSRATTAPRVPIRKRKRASDDPSTSDSEASVSTIGTAESNSSSGVKTQETTSAAAKGTKARGKKGQEPNPEELMRSWPPKFRQLERTHRALNLVYTFCSTRKQLATTFGTIKKAVEGHIGKELTVEDVAEVVAMRPGGVRLEWVDELTLLADIRGAERDGGLEGRGGAQVPPPDASVGGITGEENLGPRAEEEKRSDVLLIEFVDGDLKREVYNPKTGGTERPRRMLRNEDLRMPVYGQKQIMKVIKRRNEKFADAVVGFLGMCEEEKLDPEMKLAEERGKHVPKPMGAEAVLSAEIGEEEGQDKDGPLPKTIPKERKSIPEIIQELKGSPWYTGQIVPDGHRVFEPQEAVTDDLNFLMSQDLVNALYNARGITGLYAHQAQAISALHDGYNVVVSTSTSSGKSLIYQLPVLHELERDHLTRAMYIFPTKALAQDQRRGLKEMLAYMPGLEDTMVETFDGDTDWAVRGEIRDVGRVIFTNPDMLHITILPREEQWRGFFKNLKFVVVDELHYYNSLMGVHMAYIMRRLRRICSAVGNNKIKFVSCSATVANPLEHFTTLFGAPEEKTRLVDFDGSPSGRKEFLCWNTPFKDPGDPASGRGDSTHECARLFCQLILRGVRTIAFCRIRAQCERLIAAVRKELSDMERAECASLVMGYRGGYTAQDRRFIEKEMFDGKLLGIVATSALELGVDIGSLDAVITAGFPYSISNLRQQSGRAGRRNKDSLSVLVGGPFPTDQYFMQNPDEIFTRPNDELCVDLSNVMVAEGHVQCAAFEMPIQPSVDTKYFGSDTIDLAQLCKDRLEVDEMGYYHAHPRFRPTPSKFVNIRSTEEDDNIAIVDISNGRNIVLEELEKSRASFTVYDGAIFLHQGQKYLVRDWNPEKAIAKVEKVAVDWTTVQRDFTDIDPVETEESRRLDLVAEEGGASDATGPESSSTRARKGEQTSSRGDDEPPPPKKPSSSSNADADADADADAEDAPPPPLPVRAYKGKIRITQNVFGFFKVSSANKILDAVSVSNPPVVRHGKGAWLDLPPRCLRALASRGINVAAAIHSASHAVLSLFPLCVSGLAAGDVRTECKVPRKEFSNKKKGGAGRRRPARLTFYDAAGGQAGAGLSVKAFEFMDFLLPRALGRVEECGCPDGCVECVCDERCKEGNEVRSKAGAVVVLRCLLGWTVDLKKAARFWGEGGIGSPAGVETIVLAEEVPSAGRRGAYGV
ncbi:hypothetical protein MKZ38_005848 [Zalerion maritima]|uniref:DEAD/DEAH box helicase n=1 Tax=Zalerion maritima TaxID=339359 RepID=A0AAD5RK81_9PEZI|nr:hypothetical protein MKZ38_005848 [Zalerion maritima]